MQQIYKNDKAVFSFQENITAHMPLESKLNTYYLLLQDTKINTATKFKASDLLRKIEI